MIPAGRTTWAVYVTVTSDRNRERDEVFYVNLANASGATMAEGQAAGTIPNDDE